MPPNFTLPHVPWTPQRGPFRLSSHLGTRPIVLLFWKRGDNRSENALAALTTFSTDYLHGEPLVMGICVDGPTNAQLIAATAKFQGVRYGVLHDQGGQIYQQYAATTEPPLLILINRHGHEVERISGPSITNVNLLRPRIEAL